MFLGLRKVEGVSFEVYEKKMEEPMHKRYGDIIQQLVKDGLLQQDEQGIRLTRQGRFVGNEVFQQFWIWLF